MFCKRCGKQVKDGAVFCVYCGTKIMPSVQPVQHQIPDQPTKNGRFLMIPIAIATICIVAVAGIILGVIHSRENVNDDKLVSENEYKNAESEIKEPEDDDFILENTEPESIPDSENQDLNQQEEYLSEESGVEESQYILPNSDSAYLSSADLYGLTQEECRIARNELYARHGRKFDDEGLQEYFNSKDWYQGYIDPSDFNDSVLNEYEIANRDLIVQYEEDMGYR